MPRLVRDYKKEASYDSKPKVKKRRAKRNAARKQLMKEGLVKKGDGKDVNHKVPLSKGGSTKRSNLNVQKASKNRSYPRNKKGGIK